MFTFSFGSAFATVSWTGEATSKTLNEAGDYALNGEALFPVQQRKVLKVSQKLIEHNSLLLQKQN